MGARGKGGRSPGGRAFPLHDQRADALGGDTVAKNRKRRTRVFSLRKDKLGGRVWWGGVQERRMENKSPGTGSLASVLCGAFVHVRIP